MSDQIDGASAGRSESDAAASRRWLITIIITVVFGGFGAVMAYLSYARSSEPAVSSPRRSPSAAPTPTPLPTAPASGPAPSEGDKGKGHNKDK